MFEGFWSSRLLGFPTLENSPRGPQDRPEEARLILSQAGSHVCRRALHHPPLQVFIPGKVLGSECVEVQFHCWRSNVQKGNWSAP
eukprot:8616348-Pyramimonas_sp.AAC.1